MVFRRSDWDVLVPTGGSDTDLGLSIRCVYTLDWLTKGLVYPASAKYLVKVDQRKGTVDFEIDCRIDIGSSELAGFLYFVEE